MTSSSANHVAIVGLAGRFPGAKDASAFWQLLANGVEAIGHFSNAELEHRNADSLPGVMHVNARGVLADVDQFDAEFFNIPPREAELMDPQHRLFLQCAWHALEDAGRDPASFPGLIGVYAGVSLNTYLLYNLQNLAAGLAGSYQVGAYHTMLGNDKDFMPTRVSYKLGLRGPSMAVQTACSTSLVAIAQACQALLSFQADLCLAGGASISFPQKRDYPYTEDAMVSPDGMCRPFDAEAKGTVFGHGVGVVALRRLDDAIADGDNILAVIRGSAVNNDGADKIGFAAPSVNGQAAVIAMAQALAEVDPTTISYIEAHGTGTPMGDPIEVAALTQAFRQHTAAKSFCTIGTGKGHIGHLDVAAGVTGLIKTVLQMQHRQIPAILHFNQPNPNIDLANSPFLISSKLSPWTGPRPLRAGVSAFGVGGTNAHVVLEESPPLAVLPCTRPHQLLILSARNAQALHQSTKRLADHLQNHDLPLADVAWTLQSGRRAFAHRCFAVCSGRDDAVRIFSDETKYHTSTGEIKNPSIAFMFPGQGAQHAEMAAGLYHSEPVFRHEVTQLCALAAPLMGFDLRLVLFPTGDPTAAHERLRQTAVAQPALFTVELALAKWWRHMGVTPQACIGHSVGEYVAATLAGIMSEVDALRLVITRGQLIQELPAGTMLSIRLSESELIPWLKPSCSIASINAPQRCVAAGPTSDMAELEQRLTASGIICRPLKTSHAFHSSMMDAILPRFAEAVATVRLSPPSVPIMSCVTGTWLKPAEAIDPQYWVRHVRSTVRFADACAALCANTNHVLLEVGPGRTLTTLAHQNARSDARSMIASLPTPNELSAGNEHHHDTAAVMEALGRLWLAGAIIDWTAFHAHEPRRRVSLPGYPFATSRFWIAPPTGASVPPAGCSPTLVAPLGSILLAEQKKLDVAVPRAISVNGSDRRSAVMSALRLLLSELSGTAPGKIDATTSFLELGFDSLMLTQVSMTIQSRFKTKVSFRQLLGDLGSLTELTHHLMQTMLPDALDALFLADDSQRNITSTDPSQTAPASSGKENEFTAFGPFKPIQRGPSSGLTEQQQTALNRIVARYTARTAQSKELTQHHRSHLADPRVAAGFRSQWKEIVYPIITSRSKGTRLWDVDGNEYIDMLNGFGCILFGHAPDFVVEAVNQQMLQGFEIGPQTLLAGEAAQLMCEMTGLDRATFSNTGSEAVMAAMRLARTVTGRMRIVSFIGDYHGTFDEVLAKSVGADHRSIPIAPGIPQGKVDSLTVLPYGTDESLKWIRDHANELAAVLVEPVQSRHPALQPQSFLKEVRRITEASGAALIMDEVITGFRSHSGGAQALFGVKADLASYGKVIGGGMPIGVLCGTRKFMDALDGGMWQYGDDSFPEVGVTFFAGTFVRHPATMAAVIACLKHLKEKGPALQEMLNTKCHTLVERLNRLFVERGFPTNIEYFSSWFFFSFAPEHRLGSLLFYLLRERGIHIQEGFPCFLTTAHTDADLERVYQAFRSSVDELMTNGFLVPALGRTATINNAQPLITPAVSAKAADDTPKCTPTKIALTESQRELWLASSFSDSASCAYNESITLRLRGQIIIPVLIRAWEALIARHPALRTRFSADGETQEFIDHMPMNLVYEDWSKLEAGARTNQQLALAFREATLPFDLVNGPAIRATITCHEVTDHALVITAHHLVCDGWSMNVICDELGRLYSAFVTNQTPILGATTSFAQYVYWQDEQAREPQYDAARAFWRLLFANVPDLPDLPTDRPRSLKKTFAGATTNYHIKKELYQALKQAAARHRATLFTTLLTCFQTLIWRLSGQNDVVVGVPIAGQSLLGEAGDFLVGHCVNFLPLRSTIHGDRSVAEQLPALQNAVLDALAHQNYTYGTLAATLPGKNRDPSRLPLTEIQFNLERWASDVHFHGLDTHFSANDRQHVVFDLFVNMVESPNGLLIVGDYNRSLFDESTIQRWLGHYETLLTAFVAQPTLPVAQLPLLNASELCHYLTDRNLAEQSYPRQSCLHQLIIEKALSAPDKVAVEFGQIQLTYRELARQITLLANHLRARGIGPGKLVAVCVSRSAQLPIALLGTLAAGAAYIPLDSLYPPARILQIMEDAQPALVLTHHQEWEPFAKASPNIPVFAIDKDWELSSQIITQQLPLPSVDDLAYVIYTSGSTGRPKGVRIPHRAVVNFLCSMLKSPGIQAQDRLVAVTTISFDIAVLELFAPLLSGATVIIADRDTAADGHKLASLLNTGHATVFQATPVTMRLLLETNWRRNPNLKILCGGEALSRELANRLLPLCGELWNMYGPTETTVWSSANRVFPGDEPILIGSPIANTQFYVLDSALQPLPIGVAGNLYIGGDGIANGYVNLPELSAERFILNPFEQDTRRKLYVTGDVARYRVDGQIEFLGRSDHQVKVRGFRIELGEIESVLMQQTTIRECTVIARGEGQDTQLVAYVVIKDTDILDVDQFRTALREKLPNYMMPSAFVQMNKLTLTANGKLDRKALPAPSFTVPAASANPPNTATEKKLANIWTEFLGVTVGRNDDFFALGGHSLIAGRVMAKWKQTSNTPMEMRDVFELRTLRACALRLDQRSTVATQVKDPLLVHLQPGNRKPFFFIGGFLDIARHLGKDRPVYALDWPAERKTKDITFSDIAGECIAAMRRVQPVGPYQLGGHCFGALVAFTITNLLESQGEQVSFLLLLDPPGPTLGIDQKRLSDRVRFHLAKMIQQPSPFAAMSYLWQRVTNVRRRTIESFNNEDDLTLYHDFAPKIFSGRLTMVLAQDTFLTQRPDHDPRRDWQAWAQDGVELIATPGDHVTFCREPLIGALGQRLALLMDSAEI